MVYNFSPGPAMLPVEVMHQIQEEFLNWNGRQFSIIEMSHRDPAFIELTERIEVNFRDLYAIPNHYKILFCSGGASTHFAMVPLNLFSAQGGMADYLHTGHWSGKAIEEARRFGQVNIACTSAGSGFCDIPERKDWQLNPQSDYVYIAYNETLRGVEFDVTPDCGDVPLVADMTSTILSKPMNINDFGILFAGTQKNIAPAGLSIVIIRKDLIKEIKAPCPSLCDYSVYLEHNSMFNTPTVFSWYAAGLNFEWIKRQGGLIEIAKRNKNKAKKLYQCIDSSSLYNNEVAARYRSKMNVSFLLADTTLEEEFIRQASNAGLVALKGHRAVGGMRASLYNAMPEAGVDTLIEFMREFERCVG